MKRIGIFGWGIVAPKSPNVEVFEQNLAQATTWLEPFQGFGPSNFLVGRPEFDFSVYKPWMDERFGPRKYSQLDEKMGNMVKYHHCLVSDEQEAKEGNIAGKINMGVGGINVCVICRRW